MAGDAPRGHEPEQQRPEETERACVAIGNGVSSARSPRSCDVSAAPYSGTDGGSAAVSAHSTPLQGLHGRACERAREAVTSRTWRPNKAGRLAQNPPSAHDGCTAAPNTRRFHAKNVVPGHCGLVTLGSHRRMPRRSRASREATVPRRPNRLRGGAYDGRDWPAAPVQRTTETIVKDGKDHDSDTKVETKTKTKVEHDD
jgi:hypothetical protein